MAEEDARGRGVPAEAARHEAARRVGNRTLARELSRAVWIAPWLESLWQDARYAVRGLWAHPGFTLPALAVLVVTMGLTTGVFAMAQSLLLRPWPVADADRVVSVIPVQPVTNGWFYATSYRAYRHLRDHATTLDLAVAEADTLRLGGRPDEESRPVRWVSGNYFEVLRIPVISGRVLLPGDDTATRATVVVISRALAEAEFGGVQRAVGSVLQVDDVAFTVIGVAAAGANDDPRNGPPAAWFPVHARQVLSPSDDRMRRFFDEPGAWELHTLVGRLRPEAGREAADAETKRLMTQFASTHGLAPAEVSVTGTARIHHPGVSRERQVYALLSVAAFLTLLLGCANVGNLQLARGLSRRAELSVRQSLGAARGRLVRQLLVEGFALAAAGAVVSLLLVWQVLPGVLPVSWLSQPGLISVDGRTLLFALGLALSVTLLAGALPAVRVTGLESGNRVVSSGASNLRACLLGAQVAIGVVLLVGAGLLARAVQHAGGTGLGFDLGQVASIRPFVPRDAYAPAEREQLGRGIMDAAQEAGIRPVAGTLFPPFTAHVASYTVRLPGEPESANRRVVTHQVTSGYFETVGIPLVSGRLFDEDSSPDDVVVNESMARSFWPDQSALARVFLDGDSERHVIGVVGDVRSELFYTQHPIYYRRAGPFQAVLVRRDQATVARLLDIIRAVVPRASPEVDDLAPELRRQLEPAIALARAATGMALVALFLAAVGTLGTFSFVVSERTREIGVRLALGAQTRDVLRLLAARVSWPLMGGLLVGLAGAQALGGVLGNRLYGLSPRDPWAYALVLLVLAAAAVLATLIPARRALSVDPAVTLRAE
jgi:predicted permease